MFSNITVDNTVTNCSSPRYSNIDHELETLEAVDIAFRCFALFTHVLYFSLVLAIKELKSRSLIYIHQVNLYGTVGVMIFF